MYLKSKGNLTHLITKPGWGRPRGAEGTGWIAPALAIFGGWHPLTAAAGACLSSFLQQPCAISYDVLDTRIRGGEIR